MNKKRRQRMLGLNEKPHSHAWLIAWILVVFFYLYRVIFFHSLVAWDLLTLRDFWFTSTSGDLSLMNWYVLSFGLIACWALLEIVLALFGCFRDTVFCITVNGAVVALVVLLLAVFDQKQQALEYISCHRETLDSPLFHQSKWPASWGARFKLERDIKCSNPEYYLRNWSWEKYYEVNEKINEFTKSRREDVVFPTNKH